MSGIHSSVHIIMQQRQIIGQLQRLCAKFISFHEIVSAHVSVCMRVLLCPWRGRYGRGSSDNMHPFLFCCIVRLPFVNDTCFI